MTNLGASQVYKPGEFYRQRYIADGAQEQIAGISSDVAMSSQLYASAPDQHVSVKHRALVTGFSGNLFPARGEFCITSSIRNC